MDSARPERRVVITGVGLVSPLGNSKDDLWNALASGTSGVVPIDYLNTGLETPAYGGVAKDFRSHIDDFGDLEKDQRKAIRKGLKLMCRETMMGVATAQASLQDAGLRVGSYDPDRAGCIFGTDYMLTMPEDFIAGFTHCANEDGEFEYDRWGGEGLGKVTPLWLLRYLPNMPASHVAIYNDMRGPNNSLTMREAAANMAVGEAWLTIERGSADLMLVGATGTRIHPMNAIHAFQQEEVAATDVEPTSASRPFDKDRTGMVLGEGSGVVILESLESAENRGAHIYGEVLGRASSSVASANAVARRQDAMQNVLGALMREADVSETKIGHIHAHGLATRSSDAEEAQAIAATIGQVDSTCPVVAAKSYFGNLGAGSGIVELIASLMALADGNLFKTLNYETPDPECPIAVTNDRATPAGNSFINLSVTPQGQASGILVRLGG
jgi:3-oxoacyl-[acyl-carrier-protein] synthase II